jgi:hypothetical protein
MYSAPELPEGELFAVRGVRKDRASQRLFGRMARSNRLYARAFSRDEVETIRLQLLGGHPPPDASPVASRQHRGVPRSSGPSTRPPEPLGMSLGHHDATRVTWDRTPSVLPIAGRGRRQSAMAHRQPKFLQHPRHIPRQAGRQGRPAFFFQGPAVGRSSDLLRGLTILLPGSSTH